VRPCEFSAVRGEPSARQWTVPIDLLRTIAIFALAAAFVLMGIMHFVPGPGRAMAAMIPPRMKGTGLLSGKSLVRFTGLCEIAGGIGLLVPQTRVAASVALIVFLVAVFPANAYAARNKERFGASAIPFWPRLAGQIALIAVLVFVAL
jgi:uncharacterized membrane protein